MVPEHFLPAIGAVMVQHAWMDRNLQYAIFNLVGVDRNAGIAILSRIQMTSARAEIFKNLARVKTNDIGRLCKMLVLGDVINDLCEDRNTIAHKLPYAYSPSEDQLTYFKDVNTTNPQISAQPPYIATVRDLKQLANNLCLAGKWLGMLLPIHVIGGTSDEPILDCHPDWHDDGRFPWSDKFQKKVENESGKPQNRKRKPKARPES